MRESHEPYQPARNKGYIAHNEQHDGCVVEIVELSCKYICVVATDNDQVSVRATLYATDTDQFSWIVSRRLH